MKLTAEDFEDIASNKKHIEIRLFDEKRKKIRLGEEIEFSKLPQLQEKIRVKVRFLMREDSFKDLLSKHPIETMTARFTNKEEYLNRIYDIYTEDKERKNGILGIGIALITNGQ